MSIGATELSIARDQLLAGGTPRRPRLTAPELRVALTELFELWLTNKGTDLGIVDHSGIAVVAVGGLGRHEMLPYSDLDLVLVHEDIPPERVAEIAEQLWYPLWDAHIALDHSVRTVPQALRVAAEDLPAALGLLQARHIVGDTEVSNLLISGVRRQWRTGIRSRFEELTAHTQARWERHGQIAHRAEPDLKNGQGGLRDLQLLDVLSLAQLTDAMPGLGPDTPGGGVENARRRLLDARTELHRVAGRGRDQLMAQDADDIGAALRLGDRFDLARTLSAAARTVNYSVEVGLRTATQALPRRGMARLRRLPVRRPLDEGVVEHAGEVVLARDADPRHDPGIIVRVAAVAAQTGLPIAATTLTRLGQEVPELRAPWPQRVLNDFFVLLGAGSGAIDVIEALDRTGLWGRLIPEWGAVRDLPPRDMVHIWTVDRHLVETVAQAARLTTRVHRPDLLLLGALLHDIGKGRTGDHSEIGARLVAQIGHRLGLWPEDIRTVAAVVQQHLLLPQVATRRDLDDPVTVRYVVDRVGDPRVLELLHVLAEADSLATGPGVWGAWKGALIDELVRRCRRVMSAEELPQPAPIPAELLEQAAAGGVHLTLTATAPHSYTVTVIAPDRPGLLTAAAGVLALHSLRVHSAAVGGSRTCAINTFVVSPIFGDPPDAGLLRQELIRAIRGEWDVLAALAQRERESAAGQSVPYWQDRGAQASPRLLWVDTGQRRSPILQVRAHDRIGLLSRLAGALTECGVEVRWASVATLGAVVVDSFCLDLGSDAGPARRSAIERAVLAVVPRPAPR